MRKIVYISGTRADFGLMRRSLLSINACDGLQLSILVTGMHLDKQYGNTVKEIEASGLKVADRVFCEKTEINTGASMANNLGQMIIGFTNTLSRLSPDIILLLGDRGEMLAGAIAGLHLNIPIAHIHGGERSGTIDESIRHAISKLAHFHFVSTSQSRERLVRMGEDPNRVFEVGAPGLDGILEEATLSREALISEYQLDPLKKIALLVFHPVVQEAENTERDTENILEALFEKNLQIIAMKPNSDAGSSGVCNVLNRFSARSDFHIFTHLRRDRYLSVLANADLMIGNSSSGIIEAASFGTPVINIGTRQNLRERNLNIIDTDAKRESIKSVIISMLDHGRFSLKNTYGDGQAGQRITRLLKEIPLTDETLSKVNAY